TGGGAAAGALDRPAHRADHRAEPWTGSRYSFSPSSTNQTGIEIVRPNFLPITLILIWRYLVNRSLTLSFEVGRLHLHWGWKRGFRLLSAILPPAPRTCCVPLTNPQTHRPRTR